MTEANYKAFIIAFFLEATYNFYKQPCPRFAWPILIDQALSRMPT